MEYLGGTKNAPATVIFVRKLLLQTRHNVPPSGWVPDKSPVTVRYNAGLSLVPPPDSSRTVIERFT